MEPIARHILRKLYNRTCIGAKHTAIEHCFGGLRKDHIKEAKHTVQYLLKQQFLIAKPTSYGLHVSINPQRLEEIRAFLNAGKET